MDRATETGVVFPRLHNDVSDFELVLMAKGGDRSAFDVLVERYRPMCLQRARAVLRNGADAEDEVQNAFLRAFVHLNDFEMRANFSTWLLSIVLRRCLMTLRHNRVVPMTSVDEPKVGRYGEPVPAQFPSCEPSPEELLHRKQLARTIEGKAACLPRCFRAALASDWESPGSRHLIGNLGISLPAAKSRLRRARHELRRRVERHFRTPYSVSVFQLP